MHATKRGGKRHARYKVGSTKHIPGTRSLSLTSRDSWAARSSSNDLRVASRSAFASHACRRESASKMVESKRSEWPEREERSESS